MTVATVDALYAQALELSQDERELLATRLLLSVEREPGYDEAWKSEIERRWAAIESGADVPEDFEVVERRIFGSE